MRAVGAWVALCVALLAAATAEARPVVVARQGPLVLRAGVVQGRLCLELKAPGQSRPFHGGRCGAAPLSPFRPLAVRGYRSFAYAAAVPRSVRFARAELHNGRHVLYRTRAAAPLPGRFLLLRRAGLVRFLDADRHVLAVVSGPSGYIYERDRVQVADGVTATTQPQIAPLPGAPGRMTRVACVNLFYGSGGNGYCDNDGASGVVLQPDCEHPTLVGGVLAADASAMRLELGDGTTLTLPGQPQGPAYAGRMPFAGTVPAGAAVRTAQALAADGRVLESAPVGAAPAGQPCAGVDQEFDGASLRLSPVMAPPIVELGGADGHRLLAADTPETLCLGFDALPAAPCPRPPVDAVRPRFISLGQAVAAVLPANAARVVLHLDDGSRSTLRTTAYRGRWPLRVALTEIAAGRTVLGSVVRDARGRLIGGGDGHPRSLDTSRRVVAQHDGLGLEMVRTGRHAPCLSVFAADAVTSPELCTDLTPPTPIDGPSYAYDAQVTVACAPQQALVWGRFPDDQPTPAVLLGDGTRFETTRIALRGLDGFAAYIDPGATITGLRGADGSVPLALPPASAQCGYALSRSL